jgi:hypothetical protein
MSNYLHVLGHIKIAVKRGMIPIVDMLNYETFYNEHNLVNGSKNPWEYYFLQPNQAYSLEDVYASKNVVLSSFDFPHHEIGYSLKECQDISKIKEYNSYIEKYIKLNPHTLAYIEKNSKIFQFDKGGVLGVSVRGTDYIRLRPAGHPIQPSIDVVIESTRMLMQKWKCKSIYLCSEEEEVIDAFKRAFPCKVASTDRMRVRASEKERHTTYRPGEFVSEVKFKRDFDKYLTGLEYLTEMELLTKCNYLLCAMTSGTAAAIFINGNRYYEKEIFDLGVYPSS